MAWSPTRGLCDPFGGEKDLEAGILRAVGDPVTRFREDSLRILRGVRFGVRFSLKPEENTLKAMMEEAHLMENLARERVFDELCKLLPLVKAEDLLRYEKILTAAIPELAPMVGFDQKNHHHAYDVYTHTAHVVENVPGRLPLRWAALLHDVGKPATFTADKAGEGHFYGHGEESARLADGILRRLKAPTALREQVVLLVGHHMTKIEPTKKVVRRWLSRLGEETLLELLELQKADSCQKGTAVSEGFTPFAVIYELLEEIEAENACLSLKDLAVTGHDVMALGYTGKAIGQALNALLEQVLDEKLPNEKEALLAALLKK
jgi:tRNA nucleotidyltransferase (CCA-adding enzyme)